MTTPRQRILGRLRAATAPPAGNACVAAVNDVDARLHTPVANLVPARGQGDGSKRLKLFSEEAVRVDATLSRIKSKAGLAAEVARFLSAHDLPLRVRAAPSLRSVNWSEQPLLRVDFGTAEGDDSASISTAFGGVAETGTLVFCSGPENPTTLNFVPPVHLAVIAAADIAGDYETVWARLRGLRGLRARNKGPVSQTSQVPWIPRTVNWITGPSRTADIEQTLLLGMHGPRRLHIIVVDDETP